jgi:hypothetical protein
LIILDSLLERFSVVSSQTVLMRQSYLLYLSGENRVYQFQELFALEFIPPPISVIHSLTSICCW